MSDKKFCCLFCERFRSKDRVNKKAQVEILGLVMIVLLISIGILVAILIFSKPSGEEIRYEQEGLLAANFISTLVRSDASCKGREVGELIQNCAGSDSPIVCEDGVDACSKARSLIDKFLDAVFVQQGRSFYFVVEDKQGVVVENLFFGVPCKGEFESKTRPLVFLGGELFLKLDICY